MNKKAQVWVETVIYTLIALSLIAIVLGVATPKINNMKDKAGVEQGMEILNVINEKIQSIKDISGNVRTADIRIKKGRIKIKPSEDKISFILENTGLEFSQLDKAIKQGDLEIITEENNRKYDITINLNLGENIDLKYNDEEVEQILQTSPTTYRLSIENQGIPENEEKININIKMI